MNEKRGMLVVETGGLLARYIDIYDVSKDCHNPVFKGRFDAGVPIYHGLRVSDDGMTIYASDFSTAYIGQELHIIDVSDMSQPRLLKKWDPLEETPSTHYGIHDLEVSPDGNRAYLGAVSESSTVGALAVGGPSNRDGPTMVVLDTSDIQARKPNPDLKVIGQIGLPNFGHAEQRARINGKPYLFTSGETPFGGAKNCTWAWGNILDMSDERHPKAISEIKLEVNERDHCFTTAGEDAVYSIHYVGVDDEQNTTKVFYTYYTGGSPGLRRARSLPPEGDRLLPSQAAAEGRPPAAAAQRRRQPEARLGLRDVVDPLLPGDAPALVREHRGRLPGARADDARGKGERAASSRSRATRALKRRYVAVKASCTHGVPPDARLARGGAAQRAANRHLRQAGDQDG